MRVVPSVATCVSGLVGFMIAPNYVFSGKVGIYTNFEFSGSSIRWIPQARLTTQFSIQLNKYKYTSEVRNRENPRRHSAQSPQKTSGTTTIGKSWLGFESAAA